MYSQVIEEDKTSTQLSGDRNNSEFGSALKHGYRSAGWKGALTNGIETLKAQRKTAPSSAYGGAYWSAFMYGQLGRKGSGLPVARHGVREREEALHGFED